ncbi:hypothetical protein CL633_00155 [bacterium]|nr:hypothetical protein [bacterium]|tara:strand:- start:5001 stop:5180 length:180 start_codon:yes stop_codon:yes gene_type:complete
MLKQVKPTIGVVDFIALIGYKSPLEKLQGIRQKRIHAFLAKEQEDSKVIYMTDHKKKEV